MWVRAHNLLRAPPPPPNENPGSAPYSKSILIITIMWQLKQCSDDQGNTRGGGHKFYFVHLIHIKHDFVCVCVWGGGAPGGHREWGGGGGLILFLFVPWRNNQDGGITPDRQNLFINFLFHEGTIMMKLSLKAFWHFDEILCLIYMSWALLVYHRKYCLKLKSKVTVYSKYFDFSLVSQWNALEQSSSYCLKPCNEWRGVKTLLR